MKSKIDTLDDLLSSLNLDRSDLSYFPGTIDEQIDSLTKDRYALMQIMEGNL